MTPTTLQSPDLKNCDCPIFQKVYTSTATTPFSSDELAALLTKARAKNSAVNLSGLLLYKDRKFIQLLEGPESQVRATYSRIEQDPRHRNCVLLLKHFVPERLFSDWSMGFRELTDLEINALPGFNPFLQPAAPGAPPPAKARAAVSLLLLRIFRDAASK